MNSALAARLAAAEGEAFGAQRPAIRVVPPALSSAGSEVVDLAKQAGLALDPWQCHALDDALGEREDGLWAAFLIVILVSRQCGKGSILEARELGGLFLLGEKLILHTAHQVKALDVATPILTTAGWSTMGALREGDEVFAPDGAPTKVVGAHPWRFGRPCYRLRLDDGQEIVADAEHLWEVVEVTATSSTRRVLTTQQIVAAGVSTVQPRSGRPRRTYRFRLDLPAPLVAEERDFPISPWLLGAWLGDGTTVKGELTVGAEDLPYIRERLDGLGETYRIRPDRRWPERVFTVLIDGLTPRLRAAGILGAKHVPDGYMLASIGQRRELLAGVMDTDGTACGQQIAVTMSNARLMDDVASLVRSLGYKASLRESRARLNGRDMGPTYRVQMSASQDVSPFGMPRKTANVAPRQRRTTRAHYNAIVACDPVESRPTRCITVAHESSLYLCGRGFAPTHNTATEAFIRSKELFQRNPDLDREINRINNSHGEEGIELRNGARLRFIARSRVSGRGFSGDCVVLDEAFELVDAATDSLIPTMSARPNPQLWYTSSAVNQRHHHNGRVLARIRRRALAGGTDRLAYLDWGIDLADVEDMSPEEREALRRDPRAWRATNPGVGHRISEEHILSELDALSADGFDVERLGIGDWPVDEAGGWAVVSREAWDALADLDAPRPSPVAFAADVTPDRTHGTIGAAGRGADGVMHVEVIDHRPGTAWMVDRAVELVGRWRPVAFALDPAHEAGSLIAPLEAAGVEVVTMTARDTAQAHGQFMELLLDSKALRHRDDGDLNDAVKGAVQRDLSGAKAWDRRDSSVVLSPLVVVTAAAWAYTKHAPTAADPGVWAF